MNKLRENLVLRPALAAFAQISIGIIIFCLLILIPPPPSVSKTLYQPNWMILIGLFIFFALLLSKKGNKWESLSVVMISGLFAMPLIHKWQSAAYDSTLIGGLLPWSDASNYYGEAARLVSGLLFTTWGGRRPLFAGLLAVLLRLTGGNLIVALIMLTLMNILAILPVVQAIKRGYGAMATSAYLLIVYEFYTRFAGKTMSEQLGLALANLALFFLLVGIQTKSFWRAVWGVGLLTLALNARAGAFFILPALILWLLLCFRRQIVAWKAFSLAMIVILAVFLLNTFLARVLTARRGIPFSNYSYTLYGLASGNKGWFQGRQDHPGATESEIMLFAIQKIRENPGMLLYGIQESYKDYFKAFGGAFSFIYLRAVQSRANLLLWMLVLIGLIHSYRKREAGTGTLVLISFLGILASVSLVPPIDADSMRAFASTIPFSALWVASGVSGVAALSDYRQKQLIPREVDPIAETETPFQKSAWGLSVLVVVLSGLLPLLLIPFPAKVSSSSTPLTQPTCDSTQELLHGVMRENTSISLIPDDAPTESYMQHIRIGDFRNAIQDSREAVYPLLEEELLSLRAGTLISFGSVSDNSPNHSFSLWTISDFPIVEGEFSVCGRITGNQWLKKYKFYYLQGQGELPASLTFSQRNPDITRVVRLFYGVGLGLILFFLTIHTAGFKRHPD